MIHNAHRLLGAHPPPRAALAVLSVVVLVQACIGRLRALTFISSGRKTFACKLCLYERRELLAGLLGKMRDGELCGRCCSGQRESKRAHKRALLTMYLTPSSPMSGGILCREVGGFGEGHHASRIETSARCTRVLHRRGPPCGIEEEGANHEATKHEAWGNTGR
ncbi:hypothetical protein V8E36_004735 [Tilletia maclaganii]